MSIVKVEDVEVEQVLSQSCHPESHPLLLICHGKLRKTQILYNISEKSLYTSSLPDMRNKAVRTSNFGWLLLTDYKTNDCYLLNLRNPKEKVNLPKGLFHYSKYIFTSAPTNSSCRILFIENPDAIRFCKVGDDCFLKQTIAIRILRLATFDGKVYCLTANGALLEVEVRARSLQTRQVIQQLGNVVRSDIQSTGLYLVESGGDLLYVYQTYLGSHNHDAEAFEFLVYRADFERREWVEITSLGDDRALFLSASRCKSCSASQANIKGNSIYYVESKPRYYFDSNDRNLYVFDMEDRSVTVSSPYRKVDNDHLDLYWI